MCVRCLQLTRDNLKTQTDDQNKHRQQQREQLYREQHCVIDDCQMVCNKGKRYSKHQMDLDILTHVGSMINTTTVETRDSRLLEHDLHSPLIQFTTKSKSTMG